MINLLVDLDEATFDVPAAQAALARAGVELAVQRGAPERTLAWIDDVFGGAWSSEAAAATNVLATRGGAPAAFASIDAQGLRYPWLRGAAREPGVGLFGPFGVAPEERGGAVGPSLLVLAMHELRARGYRRALIAATNDRLAPYYARWTGATLVERFEPRAFTPTPVRTVVLASGSGTNFQAVIDRVNDGMPLDLVALVSNRSGAYALERARKAGINAIALPWKRGEEPRDAYDARLLETVRALEPQLVLLLGWMHLLEPRFVDAFPAMLNVHPAFLPLDPACDEVVLPDGTTMPAFRGARAVADALAAGMRWVGASVHEVTAQTDRGRILARKPLRIVEEEDEEAVLARLHPHEHAIVRSAIDRWLYEHA